MYLTTAFNRDVSILWALVRIDYCIVLLTVLSLISLVLQKHLRIFMI